MKLKTWHLVLIALGITIATGWIRSPIQAFDGAIRYGFPVQWWRTNTIDEDMNPGFPMYPHFDLCGFLFDLIIWCGILYVVNKVLKRL